jgi:NAD(P)-dependent dehydrogenase (short-subunit alcohol dehydrogenase family)
MTVVLVTGSNSGFGQAIASTFAWRGDSVAAAMRTTARGAGLRDAVAGAPGSVEIVQLDVTDAASMTSAVDSVVDRFGRIDVLVNNAGISHIGAFEDTPPETVEQIFATNVLGPLELIRLVLPHMRAAASGRIVNVTAIGAVLCTPYLAAYVASKHALDAATAALDLEVRTFGIRAVSVLPGPFRTRIADDSDDTADSEPYRVAAGGFRAGLRQRMADASDDLSGVVAAVVEAATSPTPAPRTVVASEVMSTTLAPMIDLLSQLHDAEARRLGLVTPAP